MTIRHRIFGLGNAGGNFLDQLLLSEPSFDGLVAINNDPDALMASVVPTRMTLAAEKNLLDAFCDVKETVFKEIENASTVLLCAGLGGITASTLMPRLAEISKAAKKTTIACVSLPFLFEGKRTQKLAIDALQALETICDGVVILDNNALCLSKSGGAGLGESFVASDEAMKVVLPGILAMLASKGPVRINRADLLGALSEKGAKTLIGYGEASGANRLHEAIEQAFKNPLLNRGRTLAKANAIFVLLQGPKDLSFAEAQAAMHEIEKVAGDQHDIQLSVQAEAAEGEPLKVFILATSGGALKSALKKTTSEEQKNPAPALVEEKASQEPELPVTESAIKQAAITPEKTPLPSFKPVTPLEQKQPELSFTESLNPIEQSVPPKEEVHTPKKVAWESIAQKPKAKPKQTQGDLNLTIAQRGRFDKSEPTIVEGEDLDTPTYLRLRLKLSVD